jgi:hypothetical protein
VDEKAPALHYIYERAEKNLDNVMHMRGDVNRYSDVSVLMVCDPSTFGRVYHGKSSSRVELIKAMISDPAREGRLEVVGTVVLADWWNGCLDPFVLH